MIEQQVSYYFYLHLSLFLILFLYLPINPQKPAVIMVSEIFNGKELKRI